MALSGMAVDAVMDSVSVKTTFKGDADGERHHLCSFSEAVREHPDLVQKYLGSVVGYRDNFFAALNSAVFPTVLSSIFRKGYVVRWSCPLISGSMPAIPDSLKEL